MTYLCKTCGFLFRRVGQVSSCPFCGGPRLRPADMEEKEQLERKLAAERSVPPTTSATGARSSPS